MSEITIKVDLTSPLKNILRYNQGLGKFGPLEQTTNGKLVKYDEVLERIRHYQHVSLAESVKKQALHEGQLEKLAIANQELVKCHAIVMDKLDMFNAVTMMALAAALFYIFTTN